jgi:hypothetical protein
LGNILLLEGPGRVAWAQQALWAGGQTRRRAPLLGAGAGAAAPPAMLVFITSSRRFEAGPAWSALAASSPEAGLDASGLHPALLEKLLLGVHLPAGAAAAALQARAPRSPGSIPREAVLGEKRPSERPSS